MDKSDKYIVALVFIFSLTVYLFTMPPTVFWQDAGIYASGIYVEGNVYPPGYPLYMILGIIWKSLVPIGTFIQKINSLSAVCGAISSVTCYLCVEKILSNKNTLYRKVILSEQDKQDEKSSNLKLKNGRFFWVTKAVALLGSMMFALNYNVWSQAINTEVYTLHMFFVTSILYMILSIGEKGRIEKHLDSNISKYIYLLAITYGVSFGNHPMTIVMLPTFFLLIFLQPNIFFHKKLLAAATGLFLVTSLIAYAYLPIKANTAPPLNWGNPNTIERFVNHVSGKVYLTGEQSFVFNDITRYQAALQEFVWEFSYLGLLLAISGGVIVFRQNKTLFVLFISIIVFHIFFAIFYKQTTEYNSWLIPAHLGVIILITIAINELIQKAIDLYNQKKAPNATLYLIPVIIFMLFWLPQTANTAHELDRRQYYYAEDFGKNILRNLDQNSLILLTGDQESSTIMYLQLVEKYRTDIIALKNIEIEDLSTLEGRQLLQKRYPTLNLELTNSTSEEVLNDLVAANLPQRSVYIMSKNMLDNRAAQFTLRPAAAMWKVERSSDSKDLDLKYWNFQYHDPHYYNKRERPLMSLKDASAQGGIKRVPFIQHMINFELQSWKNLGDWYYQQQQCLNSSEAYHKMESIEQGILKKIPAINSNIQNCLDLTQ